MALNQSHVRYPPQDSNYNNMLKTIYKENRNTATGIKKNFNVKTDPILQENVAQTKAPPKKTYLQNYIERNRFKDEKKGKKKILSKSLDLFKTSNDDKTLLKKSSKKMFATLKTDLNRQEESHHKKVFPKVLHQPTLVPLTSNEFSNREEKIKTSIKIKGDFGKPSEEIVKQNDKKKMLPIEYKSIHQGEQVKRNYSSANLKKSNIFRGDSEALSSTMRQKINYPYVKDNIRDVLSYECPVKHNGEALTKKINQNPFNILKSVDKFPWQK